jgi:hypothetical protein
MAVLRLPNVDTDTLRAAVRDLRELDMSRLAALRDDVAERDLPTAADLRRELERIDLSATLGDLRHGLAGIELSHLGLERPHFAVSWLRRLFGLPQRRGSLGPALALGVGVMVVGAVAGGVLAWLMHPDHGPRRRKAVRRRFHRLQRKVQHLR